ncbi:MAG: hypothetical protein GY751_23990 [Bacteroidetes bacterium]|nr:hypothetical protein [Bacteroidota bacterium]
MRLLVIRTFIAVLCCFMTTINVSAASISFSGFDMTSNGCASTIGSSLRLTNSDRSCADTSVYFPYGNQGGSAFITDAYVFTENTSWEASFGFNISGGADGFKFVAHNDPRGATSLAGGGHLQGYSSDLGDVRDSITSSIAVEFDTYRNTGLHGNTNMTDPNDNHIGINVNGNVNSTITANPSFDLNDSQTHYAWINYSAANDLLEVFIASTNTRPSDSSLIASLALSDIFGSQVYFGFTGGNGGLTNTQNIVDFNLTVSEVPLPASLPLFLIGLMGIMIFARKKKLVA